MQQIIDGATAIPGLRPSAPQTLPFAPSHAIRAFELRREQGNLLVCSTSDPAPAGAIERHYLSHRHEAMFLPLEPVAPLLTHERERAAVERSGHVRGTWSRRHTLDEDFEVIPIPGHTAGATAFLWDSGEHRVLFSGDSLYLRDGEWVAAVLDSSDRDAYVESLETLRELEFDVLVPWAASAGQPWHALTDRADAQRRIDTILDRIWRGDDR